MTDTMSRTERLELVKIIRARARIAKDDITAREAEIRADAEAALSRQFDAEDEAWRDVVAEGKRAVADANQRIAQVCDAKGIPAEFRPSLNTYWLDRGANGWASRRAELRKLVATRAAASAKSAKVEIDRQAVSLSERIMVGGFESAESVEMLASLPTPAQLMPALDVPDMRTKRAIEES